VELERVVAVIGSTSLRIFLLVVGRLTRFSVSDDEDLLEDEVDLDLELSSLEFSDESEPEADASCLRLIFLRSKSNAVGFFRFKGGGLFNGRLGSRATSVILTMEISSSESGTSPSSRFSWCSDSLSSSSFFSQVFMNP
jgi:hypothetical protein